MIQNCVVRTLKSGSKSPLEALSDKLNDGWIVKLSIPIFGLEGQTECIEYILEREIRLNYKNRRIENE